jgi:hypothetical protein
MPLESLVARRDDFDGRKKAQQAQKRTPSPSGAFSCLFVGPPL